MDAGIADLLIGKEAIDKFQRSNKFPAECEIPTRRDAIVSWSTPIKN